MTEDVTEDGGTRQTAGMSDVCLCVRLLIPKSESEKLFGPRGRERLLCSCSTLVSSGKMVAHLFPVILIPSFRERKHVTQKHPNTQELRQTSFITETCCFRRWKQ